MAALEWQVFQAQWQKEGGEFIPHPSTYLNEGRWEDEQTKLPQKERAPTFSEMKAKRWAS